MRIARFVDDDGAVRAGRLIDDKTAHPAVGPFPYEEGFSDERVGVQRLVSPIEPPNVFAFGRNYRAHIEETGARVPETPLVFLKATTSVIGIEDTIRLPASAPNEVDFEAELAIVIGRTAKNVSESDALGHVFGYTCANDVSARDCQKSDKQWSRAKGFDTFCPVGPWIVTADEIDPNNCGVRSILNGKVMQDSNTSTMMRPCAALISFLSRQFTLLPGTLILTGTPEGVGFARTPPVYLRAGDRIEIEIDGIGRLSNPVGSE